jgi:hypothetical protein
LVVGVKAPVECWPIAVGRVRYIGEPAAIVVATEEMTASIAEITDKSKESNRITGVPAAERRAI